MSEGPDDTALARGAAIERYRVLDEEQDRRELQAIVELAAQVAGVPTAVINIITETEQHQVAAVGLEASVCSREDSMCAAILREGRPVLVDDASLDERFARNPFVTGVIADVRFYAAFPLRSDDGVAFGTLCVFDDRPRALDPIQADALAALAARIVDMLELALRSRDLERSVQELTRAQEELRRSNRQLGRFAGQVSHDLLNPLSAVAMALELVEDANDSRDESDSDSAWALAKARTGVVRMQRMIQGLLEYARLDATLRREPVDLRSVVADVLADLAAELADAAVTVEDGLPVVRGDEVQLQALLQNLVSNAVKFTRPHRAPKVSVTARRTDDGHRIEVADNGPGVPPAARESVFELLVRNDDNVPGSGIGLATCRAIVTAHGGRIGVDEGPAGGSVFWFELPEVSET